MQTIFGRPERDDPNSVPWWVLGLLWLFLPLIIAGVLLLFVAVWTVDLVTLTAVWLTWCPRRRYALVVYSNSPIWQEYFETQVLPAAAERAAVLNWSERKHWQRSLPVVLFRRFSGSREFNPIAIVFRPFRRPRRFRFYRAFRAFKHGRPEEVERLRLEFLTLLNEVAPIGTSRHGH